MGLRIGKLTFGGISSGLPTQDIIEKLLDLERRPITQLETRKEQFTTRLGIFSDLAEKTRTLRDRLRDLDNLALLGDGPSVDEEFARFSATSTDDTVVSATASGGALPTTLDVRVTALATAERRVSQGFATRTTSVGTGTFAIKVGSGATTTLTIDSSNNTVEGLVRAINDADAGVTASILNDGSGTPFRIVLQGNDSGAANALTITPSLAGGTAPVFVTTQDADDAEIVLDPDGSNPITINSATNTFSDILTGVSLTVSKVSADGTSERITVAPDLDAIVDAIKEIVTAFNDVTSIIQDQFKVDPTTNRGGPLIGDSTLSSLKTRLTSVIANQAGTGSITTAGQIGLSLGDGAALELDEDELRAALESDFDGVRSFFAGTGGLADGLRTVADAFVDTVDGALVSRINGTSRSIQDLDTEITSAESRLDVVEESLVRQFAALERIVSEIQVQGNFLAQFVTQQRR